MAKRRCFSDHTHTVSKRDRSNIDALLESLFAQSTLIDASFDDLVESRHTDSDQNEFIQRVFHLGSVLLEARNRFVRKQSSVHNVSVWSLPHDLTVKVFSMVETRSVCSAAATCLLFQKCAMDPICYANIDLATSVPKVNEDVVSTMIQRAGNVLRSIKLGVLSPGPAAELPSHRKNKRTRQGRESPILTSSWLSSLSMNGGAPGSHLRRLHLSNIERMDNIALFASLSVCPYLVDLEIVGLDVDVSLTLESVSRHCHLIEHFVFDISKSNPTLQSVRLRRNLFDDYVTGKESYIENSACEEFVLNCPKITTLALKGCELHDDNALMLVKGLHELKYVDFSTSFSLTGAFLNTLGTNGGGNNLEVMILHDCSSLKKVEVKKFMKALLAGKFMLLRHLDISNDQGRLPFDIDRDNRHYSLSSLPKKQLLEQRPNFYLVDET